MLSVKLITPNLCFTRRRWYLQGQRRPLLMLGTVMIVCQSEKKIATSSHSSRFGIGTDTKLVHKATLLHRTDTPEDSTRLSCRRDFSNKTKCIDDTCLWADTFEESFFQTCRWLDICGRHGNVQNPEKFVFKVFQVGSDAVEFAGFVITPTDIQPSDKHIRTIRDFPTPQNITDIRSWFGLINQVSYCDSLHNDMAPFREHHHLVNVLLG